MSSERDCRGSWIVFAGEILAALILGLFTLVASNKGNSTPSPAPPLGQQYHLELQIR
jgi:hypothetical protein